MKCPKCGTDIDITGFCNACFTDSKRLYTNAPDINNSNPSITKNIKTDEITHPDIIVETKNIKSSIDPLFEKSSLDNNFGINPSWSNNSNEFERPIQSIQEESNSDNPFEINPSWLNNSNTFESPIQSTQEESNSDNSFGINPSWLNNSNTFDHHNQTASREIENFETSSMKSQPTFQDYSYDNTNDTVTHTDSLNGSVAPPNPKKSHKMLFAIIAASIIVLASLGAFAYRNADYILSPKNYYLFIESKNASITPQFVAKEYSLLIDTLLKQVGNLQLSKKITISPKFELSDAQTEQTSASADTAIQPNGAFSASDLKHIKIIQDIVNQLKIATFFDSNTKEQKHLSKIGVSFKDNNIADINYVQNGNLFGLYFPQLYKNYILVDSKKIDNKNNLNKSINDIVMSQSINPEEFIKAIDLDRVRVEKILTVYQDIFISNILNENVTISRDSFVDDEEGGKIPAKEIIVTFKSKDYNKISQDILQQLSTDETLKSSLYNTAKNLVAIYKNHNMYENELKIIEEKIEKLNTEWKENLEFAAESLKDDPNVSSDDSNSTSFVMHVYVDSWGNYLERRIEKKVAQVSEQKPDTNDTSILGKQALENKINEDILVDFKKLKTTQNNFLNACSVDFSANFFIPMHVKITLADKYKKVDSSKSKFGTKSFVVNVSEASNNSPTANYAKIFIDYTHSIDSMSDSGIFIGDYKFGSEYSANNMKNPSPITGTLKVSELSNKTNAYKYDLSIDILEPQIIPKKLSIGFVAESETPSADEIKYPDFATEPSINISDLNEEEMQKLTKELSKSGEEFLLSLQKTFPQLNELTKTSKGNNTPSGSKESDEVTAKLIESAVNVLIAETGSVDFAKMKSTSNKTLDKMSSIEFVFSLQSPIDFNGKKYGPYLSNSTNFNHMVQWTPAIGGKHVGFKLFIDTRLKKAYCKPITNIAEAMVTIS